MTQDTVEQYAQAIIDVGAEVDSHIDGDARIQTFTFNEAQLVAFVELVARAERAKVVEWLEEAQTSKDIPPTWVPAQESGYQHAIQKFKAHLSDK